MRYIIYWIDHYAPVGSVLKYAVMIKNNTSQLFTFREKHLPWLNKLKPLAEKFGFYLNPFLFVDAKLKWGTRSRDTHNVTLP